MRTYSTDEWSARRVCVCVCALCAYEDDYPHSGVNLGMENKCSSERAI